MFTFNPEQFLSDRGRQRTVAGFDQTKPMNLRESLPTLIIPSPAISTTPPSRPDSLRVRRIFTVDLCSNWRSGSSRYPPNIAPFNVSKSRVIDSATPDGTSVSPTPLRSPQCSPGRDTVWHGGHSPQGDLGHPGSLRKPFRYLLASRRHMKIQKVVGQQRVNVASNISAGTPRYNRQKTRIQSNLKLTGASQFAFKKGRQTLQPICLGHPRVDTARESSEIVNLGLSPKSEQLHRRGNSRRARTHVPCTQPSGHTPTKQAKRAPVP